MNDTDDDNFPLFITNYVADQIAQPSLFVYLLHFRRYISLQLFFFQSFGCIFDPITRYYCDVVMVSTNRNQMAYDETTEANNVQN